MHGEAGHSVIPDMPANTADRTGTAQMSMIAKITLLFVVFVDLIG
jgi:hypothetical protein